MRQLDGEPPEKQDAQNHDDGDDDDFNQAHDHSSLVNGYCWKPKAFEQAYFTEQKELLSTPLSTGFFNAYQSFLRALFWESSN